MKNLVFMIWLGSTSKKTYIYNESLTAYENACRLFDEINDDTFINPDDVIEKVANVLDECINHLYDTFGGTVDYEYREMSGEEYTDTLIIDIA